MAKLSKLPFGIWCGLLVIGLVAQVAASTVERTVDRATVTLSVAPTAGVPFQFVEETLPEGFSPANVTGGGAFDDVNRALKWGLFFDDQPRELQYDLVGPAGFSGFVEVSGTAIFGGTPIAITGDTLVGIGNLPQPPVFRVQPQSATVVEGDPVRLVGEVSGTPPLTFQWTRDGALVSGAADPVLVLDPSVPQQSGLYRLVANNAQGSATSDAALVIIEPKPPEPTGPLAIAVDSPFLFWTPGGAGEWGVETAIFDFGDSSITFDDIAEGERTWIETSVIGPGTLTFRWKVSSEACDGELCDYVQFSLNGVPRETLTGEVDWESVVLTLPIGEHQLRWEYIKDDFTTAGDDKFWLDGVAFGPGFPVPIRVVGDGDVALAPDRLLYQNGDQILLQATPGAGQSFQAWQDPIHAAESEVLYSVTGFQTITAVFGDDFITALDLPGQVWTTGGDTPWTVVNDPVANGGSAARSGDIDDGQVSTIATRILGPGVLRFRWRVSSEVCADELCDFMFLNVNGLRTRTITGETGWEEIALNLPSGEHTVEWGYTKDIFTTLGEDAGWLDHVRYEPRVLESAPITGLEYYVNEDPGEGNGIPLAIDQEEFVLPVEGLEPGTHFLTVRAKEEVEGETLWSHHHTVPFTIRGVDEEQQLTSLSYFFDDDPGDGNRIPLSPAAAEVEIPVEGLAPGPHRLEFRIAETFRGEVRPSGSVNVPIAVDPEDFTGRNTRLEYYVGDDPGFGNGTPLPLEGGLLDIPASGLAPGYHLLTVRALQAGPGEMDWSLGTQHGFEVLPSTATDDVETELAEIRFQFLTGAGQLTEPMVMNAAGNALFDGSVDVVSDLLRQPGVLIGRAIAVNVLGQESSAAWFEITVDGDFTSPWRNWLALHFSEDQLNDESITGPNADPDADGVPNLLELATGGDPLSPDTTVGLVELSRAADGSLELRTRALSRATASTEVPYESQGLRYEIESASDGFNNWAIEALQLAQEPAAIDETVSELIFQIPFEPAEVAPQIFRLRVSPTDSFQF